MTVDIEWLGGDAHRREAQPVFRVTWEVITERGGRLLLQPGGGPIRNVQACLPSYYASNRYEARQRGPASERLWGSAPHGGR
jgi:hypothetical protein